MPPTILPQSVSVSGYGTSQEEATQHNNALTDGSSMNDSLIQPSSNTRRSYITLAILLGINLLNYADRYTIAGVFHNYIIVHLFVLGMLVEIQKYYGANNIEGGLFNVRLLPQFIKTYVTFLQTVFICSFMLFAPLFGYLGDRFARKPLMIIGISIWVAAVAAATFVPAPEDNKRKV
jgi:MFS family permease